MRGLILNACDEPVTAETLLAIQFRTANEPFLPRLKSFECYLTTETFIPFLPLFLSPQTTEIYTTFAEGSPTVAVASIIGMFPTLCPNLECITIYELEINPVIIDAVSEMLLVCNQVSLRFFYVDCPLTEEAREVVYRLPNLSGLWTVIKGDIPLPPVALPDLTTLDLQYGDHLDWLQGFRGASLENLESVSFRSESERIGDFLGAFESVALTTSAQNTLSSFEFHTSRSWSPNYFSLLSFKQLEILDIMDVCGEDCSSRVNDDVITALAQAMPKLEVLHLGNMPCGYPAVGATVHGLIALASRCPNLSKLRIHFRGDTLVDAATSAGTTFLPIGELVVPRQECALTSLDVGCIRIPLQSVEEITLLLLQIFPRILVIDNCNPEWEIVTRNIEEFRRLGTFVRHIGQPHSLIIDDP